MRVEENGSVASRTGRFGNEYRLLHEPVAFYHFSFLTFPALKRVTVASEMDASMFEARLYPMCFPSFRLARSALHAKGIVTSNGDKKMPHRNIPKKIAKRQKNWDWDKKVKTLRKQYQAKPKENATHGEVNAHLSFHMATVTVGGRQKAHPVPREHSDVPMPERR